MVWFYHFMAWHKQKQQMTQDGLLGTFDMLLNTGAQCFNQFRKIYSNCG